MALDFKIRQVFKCLEMSECHGRSKSVSGDIHSNDSQTAEVIDFQQPYCLDVTRISGTGTEDKTLERLTSDIEALSSRLSPWHQAFSRMYFADLSFLTSAMIFDVDRLLKMKVDIVREYVSTGTSKILNDTLEDVSDFFS